MRIRGEHGITGMFDERSEGTFRVLLMKRGVDLCY